MRTDFEQYLERVGSGVFSERYDRVAERRRAVALAGHYREVEGLSIAEIARRLGRSPATVKAYFYDPTGEKAKAVKHATRGSAVAAAPHPARGGKGDAYAYCKGCHPGAIAPRDARLVARLDARMAPAIRHATLVNRLVTHTRPQARRRSAQATKPEMAVTLDGHRHLRHLGCGSRRRLPRRSPRGRGASAQMPGTYDEVPGQISQRNHAADRDTPGIDGWHELAVANPTYLLERLGSECTDLQGLRELTVNGLDAIAARARAGGRVVWDMDWLRFDASGGRVRKLSVTDTGTGMTPSSCARYINQLASSFREQSAAG